MNEFLANNWGWISSALIISLPLGWVNLRYYLVNRRLVKIKDLISSVNTFVDYVDQTFKNKPEGMTAEEWNETRMNAALEAAMVMAESTYGITLTDLELNVLEIAIEAFLKTRLKPIQGAKVSWLRPSDGGVALLASNNSVGEATYSTGQTINDQRASYGLGTVPWGDIATESSLKNWNPEVEDDYSSSDTKKL